MGNWYATEDAVAGEDANNTAGVEPARVAPTYDMTGGAQNVSTHADAARSHVPGEELEGPPADSRLPAAAPISRPLLGVQSEPRGRAASVGAFGPSVPQQRNN